MITARCINIFGAPRHHLATADDCCENINKIEAAISVATEIRWKGFESKASERGDGNHDRRLRNRKTLLCLIENLLLDPERE